MTTLYFQRKALLAKIESAYGTDPSPTGSANAILASNFSITPIESVMNDRAALLPYYGTLAKVPAGAFVKMEFNVDIAGAGALGDVPAYGPLLRACGKTQTNNGSAGIVYAPDAPGATAASVTLYFHLDGVLHKALGCVGNVAFDLAHEGLPQYKFTFTGIYSAVTDAALPTVVLSEFVNPLPVNKVNTTFSLHSYSAILSKLSIDSGAQVEAKDYVNAAQEVRITDRKPSGSVSIEAALVADKGWWAIARAATLGTLSVVQGQTDGNKVMIACPSVQIENPKYTDAGGVVMLEMGLVILPSGGNDEITVTVA